MFMYMGSVEVGFEHKIVIHERLIYEIAKNNM